MNTLNIIDSKVPDDLVANAFVKLYGELSGRAFLLYKEGKEVNKNYMEKRQVWEDCGYYRQRGNGIAKFGRIQEENVKRAIPFSMWEKFDRASKKSDKFFFFVKEHLTCKEIRLLRLLMRGYSKEECAKRIPGKIKDRKSIIQSIVKETGLSWREASKYMYRNASKYAPHVAVTTIWEMCSRIRSKLEVVMEPL